MSALVWMKYCPFTLADNFARFVAICIRRFIKDCRVIGSFALSECWTKTIIYLIITLLVTNLSTQSVGLIPWIHEEYLLVIFSKMIFPSGGMSHQISYCSCSSLCTVTYSVATIIHIKGNFVCFSPSETAQHINSVYTFYKFFMNMWSIAKDFYFIKKITTNFLI